MRASKITWMSQVERKTDAEMKEYMGYKDVRNLHIYIKVDKQKQLAELLEFEKKKHDERTK